MAQLPHPVHAQPATLTDYLRAHSFFPYRMKPGRWDVYDPASMQPGETADAYIQRATLAATYWAQDDAKEDATQAAPTVVKRSPGRPRVHPLIPGESAEDRRARLSRERREEYRRHHGGIRLTVGQLKILTDWAWWEGCQAGRGDGAPPEEADIHAKLDELLAGL